MITDMSRDYNKCNNEWNLKDVTCILTQNNMEYRQMQHTGTKYKELQCKKHH
jgi:hypothetical protein